MHRASERRRLIHTLDPRLSLARRSARAGSEIGHSAPRLRATFVTWAMRQGRGDGWISDRTGHLTPEMRGRYARAARVLADHRYQPFPELTGTIPELWDAPGNVRSIATARWGRAEP
jgi:hypothetical protein